VPGACRFILTGSSTLSSRAKSRDLASRRRLGGAGKHKVFDFAPGLASESVLFAQDDKVGVGTARAGAEVRELRSEN
jgi:hypothetical protein